MRTIPGLHRDFQIGEHVRFIIDIGVVRAGYITGVAMQHIVFTYIITLDEPISVDGWERPWTTVVMPGGCLL